MTNFNAEKIDRFDDEFKFLSNFYLVNISYEGKIYPSTEHAYQAAKTIFDDEKDWFCQDITSGRAKKLGKQVTMRPDWNKIKIQVMTDLTRIKYKNPQLRDMLLLTDGFYIEEGNYWGDTFWGVCNGVGDNNLGKILMQVREEIKQNSIQLN